MKSPRNLVNPGHEPSDGRITSACSGSRPIVLEGAPPAKPGLIQLPAISRVFLLPTSCYVPLRDLDTILVKMMHSKLIFSELPEAEQYPRAAIWQSVRMIMRRQ